MPRKIAIDWDETEIRLVTAQCAGSSVKVTDAVVLPIRDGDVRATLRDAITERSLGKTDALVAIGRGKAELRDLQLPSVPDDELPDMVRFQAIRSFASAGDSATVDYLITNRTSDNIQLLAAAVGPTGLKEITSTCSSADVVAKRIALRPLAAAALYFAKHRSTPGEYVLIDLLSNDAEIVVARDGKVVFVRTVRMPSTVSGRSAALVSELKRSLVACGSSGSPQKVILWGRESVHQTEATSLREAAGDCVEIVNPFDLVDISKSAQAELPEHVGRLAPLVGLLRNDEGGEHRLIDFLNPRKRIIKEPNPLLRILAIAAPIAAIFLLGFFVYKKFRSMDDQIALLKKTNSTMADPVKAAEQKQIRTETIDKFLDGDVNWLNEIRRLADKMPGSKDLIVQSIRGESETRRGGGTLTLIGSIRDPKVIDSFEDSVRDDEHRVVGEGSSENTKSDGYKWKLDEKVIVDGMFVRNQRYAGLNPLLSEGQKEASDETSDENSDEGKTPEEAEKTHPTVAEEAKSVSEPPAEDEQADPSPATEQTEDVTGDSDSDSDTEQDTATESKQDSAAEKAEESQASAEEAQS